MRDTEVKERERGKTMRGEAQKNERERKAEISSKEKEVCKIGRIKG